MKFFNNDAEGVFLRRPNRFTVLAEVEGREEICHCADPGKLRELLFPGASLILERAPSRDTIPDLREKNKRRKTRWTLAAVRYRNEIVPLISSRANKAAENLVLPLLFPEAKNLRSEFTVGSSRFDFYFEDRRGGRHLLEVKACSLVDYKIALFPDSPSERALKHLLALGELSRREYRTHFLFVITHGNPEVFRPNLHAHPSFAEVLSERENPVEVHAASIRSDEEGETELVEPRVRLDLSHGGLASSDSGSYLVVLKLAERRRIAVGALGEIDFPAGYYVYAGSAMKNLRSRTERHLRKIRKKLHWHLDYLVPVAESVYALPIASYRNLECSLAEALGRGGGSLIPGFGSSDCGCPSHLAYFARNPLWERTFIDLLLRFRHIEAFLLR